jgi:hypothetical protein
METYRTFPTLDDARKYRHEHGTGGWIFSPEKDGSQFYPFHDCILFPPSFTPSQICVHPFTKGRGGKLIP